MAASFRAGCSIFRRSETSIFTASLLAEISWSRTHPVGHRLGRNCNWRDHHTPRRRPRYRRHAAQIICQSPPIRPSVDVFPLLAEAGRSAHGRDAVGSLRPGRSRPSTQDEDHATLAPILKREDGAIDFTHSGGNIQSLARLSTVAGSLYHPQWEEASHFAHAALLRTRPFIQGNPAKSALIRVDGFWRVATTV